jgi:ATP-dependent DNA helicase PIF1
MTLNREQKAAMTWVMENPTESAAILGGAGTGKSHVLLSILAALEQKTHVAAPTGIAAVNVNGTTLYKFLGAQLGFEGETMESVKRFALECLKDPKKRRKVAYLQHVHTLVIDEISMVHASFFRNMDTYLRVIRDAHQLPMGGIRVIMVGDFLQLPPVDKNKNSAPWDTIFVFETESWVKLNPRIFILEHSYRQEGDQRFFHLLKELRWGLLSSASKALLQRYVRKPPPSVGVPMSLMPKNDAVDAINKKHIDAIPQPLMSFKAMDTGAPHLLRDLRALPLVNLKVGAQVMLLKNLTLATGRTKLAPGQAPPPDRTLPNGAIGRVVGFSGEAGGPPGDPLVEFPTIGNVEAHVRLVRSEMFDVVEAMGERPVASRLQHPLVVAYAMSIHKAQGQTIASPIFTSTKDIFDPGMFYVLLSRAKSIEQLYLQELDVTKIFANEKAVAFMRQYETMPRVQ